jgi:hypothetical protein
MFPVFPVLFPVCSQSSASEILKFPVFSVPGHDPYGLSVLVMAISSTTKNTGNIRNRIEMARFRRGAHVEHAWNTGNRLGEPFMPGNSTTSDLERLF